MNNKGNTTVLFSLMIGILFLFTLTALEVGRIHFGTVKINPCVHSMRSSVMADYNADLFERYHLLFLDPTYGTGSEAVIEEKIVDYLENSLNGEEGSNIYQFTVEEIALAEKESILSNNMKALEKQIVEYEETVGLINRLTGLLENMKEKKTDTKAAMEETKNNAVELPSASEKAEENEISEDVKETLSETKDPRDILQDFLELGLLTVVAPGKEFSKQEQNLSNAPSKRYEEEQEEEKSTLFNDISFLNTYLEEVSAEDVIGGLTKHAAFASYSISHFSNGVNGLENSVMQCEVEYILKGKDNDYDNMEAVVKEMLWLRMPVNYAYLLTDVEKSSQALTLSATLCTATGTEPFIEVVKYLLLGCWAYGESLYELQELLAGEKIPYMKTTMNWYTDLYTLTAVNNVEKISEGMSYEDYLMILLAKKCGKKQDVAYARLLDVMEINLRKSNPSFCITDCVSAMTIQGKISMNPLFQKGKEDTIYDYYFEEKIVYE